MKTISSTLLAVTLLLAGSGAFAQDAMKKDSMAKDAMTKDTMAKDAMGKDSMKKDAMTKDSMAKDSMKKDIQHGIAAAAGTVGITITVIDAAAFGRGAQCFAVAGGDATGLGRQRQAQPHEQHGQHTRQRVIHG